MADESPRGDQANERRALVAWLLDPRHYAEPTSVVKLIETHISQVLITDQIVYKLKKPVRFDFLDFSTLELRHQACDDEVRLNRRLATDIYLGVAPIYRLGGNEFAWQRADDAARPCEYVVRMVRLPDEAALDRQIHSGQVDAEHLARLARKLADFYQVAPRAALTAEEFRAGLVAQVQSNRRDLLARPHHCEFQVRRIHAAQLQRLALNPELFEERAQAGRVIEGHGDLRSEHVYMQAEPQVIDCVEFNPGFRRLDWADELAFLAMECDALGAASTGAQVLRQCLEILHDCPPPRLLAFYKSYRACVRAKVAALRADQTTGGAQAATVETERRYLALAESYLTSPDFQPRQPLLLVVAGLAGSGKSTLAAAAAELLGMEHLQTDAIRGELLGADESNAAVADDAMIRQRYSVENRAAVYAELFRRAAAWLSQGVGVVLDGTFIAAAARRSAAEIAAQCRAELTIIGCDCPAEVAQQRIAARLARGGSLSEARPQLYLHQLAEAAAGGDLPTDLTVDTTQALARQLAAICRRLAVS